MDGALNNMEIRGIKYFIPKRIELGTTLSQPNWSIKYITLTSVSSRLLFGRILMLSPMSSEYLPINLMEI